MKITVSLQDVTNLICEKYGLPFGTIVSVEGASRSRNRRASIPDNLQTMIKAVSGMNYNSNQKIEAIKHVRIVTNCGLYEAKCAVERWPETTRFIQENGKFPIINSAGKMS